MWALRCNAVETMEGWTKRKAIVRTKNLYGFIFRGMRSQPSRSSAQLWGDERLTEFTNPVNLFALLISPKLMSNGSFSKNLLDIEGEGVKSLLSSALSGSPSMLSYVSFFHILYIFIYLYSLLSHSATFVSTVSVTSVSGLRSRLFLLFCEKLSYEKKSRTLYKGKRTIVNYFGIFYCKFDCLKNCKP